MRVEKLQPYETTQINLKTQKWANDNFWRKMASKEVITRKSRKWLSLGGSSNPAGTGWLWDAGNVVSCLSGGYNRWSPDKKDGTCTRMLYALSLNVWFHHKRVWNKNLKYQITALFKNICHISLEKSILTSCERFVEIDFYGKQDLKSKNKYFSLAIFTPGLKGIDIIKVCPTRNFPIII